VREADIRPADLFNRYLALSEIDAQRLLGTASDLVAVPCPACGDVECDLGITKLGMAYQLCRGCASLYASPRPTAAALDDFYRNAESVKFWSSDFFRLTAEARRERMFRPRARLLAEVCGEHLQQADLVVDVGCGYGLFLEEAARLGTFARVLGIEPGPDLAAISRARGFEVVEKAVEDIASGEVQADAATCFEVLEHVFDPLRFLRSIAELLRPGGVALLTTLTSSGFDIQVLWERSKSVFPPHHLNLLSIAGLERLVARAGLTLLSIQTPGKLDVDIVVNTVREDPAIQLPRFVANMLARQDEASLADFQEFLQRNRFSSHVQLIVRRAES
jgi:SAM-dependent methyltransferase